MGRPIKAKYFGNTNSPGTNFAGGGTTGLGGELVSSTIVVANTGSNYSTGITLTFSAPQLPGGIRATGTPTTPALGGGVTAATLVLAGSGYTSTATIAVTKPTTVTGVTGISTTASFTLTNLSTVSGIYVGMKADAPAAMQADSYVTAIGTDTVTLSKTQSATSSTNVFSFSDAGTGATFLTALTNSQQNAIKGLAFLKAVDGGTAALLFDIKKQEASKRYLVNTSEGRGQCKLVTSGALAAGEMNIIATDGNGSTYFVKKLTARRAVLVQSTASGSFLYNDGSAQGWTLGSPATGIVSLGNN